jgi:hypothetical protein
MLSRCYRDLNYPAAQPIRSENQALTLSGVGEGGGRKKGPLSLHFFATTGVVTSTAERRP